MLVQDLISLVLLFAVKSIDVGPDESADVFFNSCVGSFAQELCKRSLLFWFQLQTH